ncbi:hypothetical protein SD80_014700 [Scytonema tolypothrichoides VB-61278]|nr:hypothetical protein SD80_014700 [Scytonema tolypothrichoides VB-61278]
MPYSDFTLARIKRDFGIKTAEGGRFLPETQLIEPSLYLKEALSEGLPLAIATGSEKARSELIISPILVEVRKILQRKVSFFSGEDFTVAPELGLSGVCDFLISRSCEQVFIEAPAVIVVEAKKADLKAGLGQCAAEMIAAQKFNEANNIPIPTIYGSVSSGTAWRFLKLEGQILSIDFNDYPVPPVEVILGMLVWMVREG